MSSSIELINPKAESVRRAAALQVSVHSDYTRSDLTMSSLGQYQWGDGTGGCGQGKSWCVDVRLNLLPYLIIPRML